MLKLWQGLGYYSRARNLHAAAKTVATEFGGQFPQNYADIRALKGVGDYTAAAIASIAYGLPHAVLDGNVYRVLARVFCIPTPINSSAAKAEFGKLAQELLDPEQPGDYNEALMELGATVCTPRSPLCSRCPVQKHCRAYEEGRQEEFPLKEAARAPRERFFHYLLIRRPNGLYVKRRGGGDVWQGLYDLPLCETASVRAPTPAEWQQATGCAAENIIPLQSLTHILSHQRLRLFFYEAADSREPLTDGIVFADMQELKKLPVPKPIEIFFRDQLNAPKLL